MSMQGPLVRCPNCIAPIPGAVATDGTITLEPEGNRCPRCGHVFSAARALDMIEDYPKARRRLMAGSGKKQEELFR